MQQITDDDMNQLKDFAIREATGKPSTIQERCHVKTIRMKIEAAFSYNFDHWLDSWDLEADRLELEKMKLEPKKYVTEFN